jgi:urease accessory protein
MTMRHVADEAACTADKPTMRAGADHWIARLRLGFDRDGDTTRLMRREHVGPLRVQKPLYPEHPSICHSIIVHPPGGVVGGDELHIDVDAGPEARALLATPGAAKWYRSNGHRSRQRLRIHIAKGAALEWLPQETIIFNAADIELDTLIDLGGDATYIGCEILCFGRTASDERFDQGRVQQSITIRRDGKPLWLEQGLLQGGSRPMLSPLGLGGHSVCASLIAVSPAAGATVLNSLREQCAASSKGRGQLGVTHMKSVIIVRYLGNTSEVAREVMLTAWKVLRPALLGSPAVVPRIWNT